MTSMVHKGQAMRNCFTISHVIRRWSRMARSAAPWSVLCVLVFTGCGPTYRNLRHEGQRFMIAGNCGEARMLFEQADKRRPNRIQNLHDLAVCSQILAKDKFMKNQRAAALREIDYAIEFYRRAIRAYPGHQPSLEGLNTALELKGQFDQALDHAEWAARFVGPSAKQYIFLAKELEERGQSDEAMLRYKQAVAIDGNSAQAHSAFAKFLIKHGRDQAAIHHLQRAFQIDPRDEWVRSELIARSALPSLVPAKSGGS